MFTRIFTWNDDIFVLVPTPAELMTFTVQPSGHFGAQSTLWAKISARSVLDVLSIFLAIATMQRYLRGIALGAIKVDAIVLVLGQRTAWLHASFSACLVRSDCMTCHRHGGGAGS
jgi:hypothetical protein